MRNHKGTRMATDGEDQHGLQTTNLKLRLNVSIYANHNVAPLSDDEPEISGESELKNLGP